jgi:hypothetical protein
MSTRIIRTARRTKRDRFLSYTAEHAARAYTYGRPDGEHVTIFYSESGNPIAAAEYGVASRAVYHVKHAH